MPTGYTAMVGDGCTFEAFVWACARAFGALVTMRDDSADETAPEEFKPSPHYAEKVASLEAELARLSAMTPEDAKTAALAEHEGTLAANKRYLEGKAKLATKYRVMLERVRAWEPPSDDHAGLRRFMIEQIEESLDFDCRTPYQRPLPTLDAAEWRSMMIGETRKSLAYYLEEFGKELKRTNERNEWIRLLRKSVPQPAKSAA